MTGSVFILADCCEGDSISRILNKLTKDDTSCKLLGDPRRFSNHCVSTLPGLFMTAYKQARLEKNERQILLSHEDHLIAVQLCLAEMNRQNIGDFDVEMSKVLEMSRKINKKKLTNAESEDLFDDVDDEFSQLFDAYNEFLQSCNVYDLADLYRAVLDNSTLDVVESVFKGSNFILLQAPSTDIEKEMLQFVCREKTLVKLTCEEELNQGGDVNIITDDVADFDDVIALLKKYGPSSSPESVTEGYIRSIFVSYLHLLVNSRNELSLARVINIPDRELDQQAFTDIKRVAKEKNMSMCQVALSYVMKIRLGGRSYAPDPNSPLGPHVKGLGDFTDLIHKLQMFAEEEPNVKTSISKVIRVIKNAIVKCKETLIKTDSVERVAEKLTKDALMLSENMEELYGCSPERKASEGGSALGRRTLKVFRALADEESTLPFTSKAAYILSDVMSSQRTPIRFPCLMSKFRSPENLDELVDEPELNAPLAHRLKAKFHDDTPKKPVVPRFQSCMDWAGSKDDIGINKDSHILSEKEIKLMEKEKNRCNVVRSSLLNNKKEGIDRKPVESRLDQENIILLQSDNKTNSKCDSNEDSGLSLKEKLNPKVGVGSRKRKKDSSDEPKVNAAKKVKKAPVAQKSKKSKVPEISKGQKRLTDFFRL